MVADLPTIAADVTAYEVMREDMPLALVRLWHRTGVGEDEHGDPRPRTSQRDAVALLAGHRTVYVGGGNRCLGGEAPVLLADGTTRRIDEIREPTMVQAWTGTHLVPAMAYPTPTKGPDPLHRVTLATGETFRATAGHRVHTGDGWRPVRELRPGDSLRGVEVVEVAADDDEAHYDLVVPLYNSFVAAGIVHHNSGKSFSMLAAFVALALGSDHPSARAFWLGNGIDPDSFPAGPANAIRNDGEVWLVALTSGASMEYHRGPVEALLGPGTYKWSNRDGRGPAKLEIRCPGYDYPAVIRFKSEDQKRRGMQGQRCRGVLHDEEGETDDVWDECGTRCVDSNGWHAMANTPVAGVTWVDGRLVSKTGEKAEAGCKVYHIHSVDNPHLDPVGLARLQTGSVALRAAKLYGRAQALHGLVYSTWHEATHVRPLEEVTGGEPCIPADWPRFQALDFGARHNTCALWGAMGTDGLLVVYRELYVSGLTTAELARRILTAEGAVWREERALRPGEVVPDELRYLVSDGRLLGHWDMSKAEQITTRWGDPSALQVRRDLKREHGILVAKANRDWLTGVGAVEERLSPAADGRPRVVVVEGAAPNLCREIGTLAYPAEGRRDVPPPRPHGGDDATDTFRYLCMGLRHY